MNNQKWNSEQYEVKVHKDYYTLTAIDIFNQIMNDDKILSITRLGGVDFEIAEMYYNNPACFEDPKTYNEELFRANNFPGYFDFKYKKENFLLYAQKLVSYFKDFDFATYAGKNLIDKINGEVYIDNDIPFFIYILRNKAIMHYAFMEAVIPFLNSFKTWGENKKILIISPFSKSLQFQYQHLNNLIKDYTFPKFELVTCNTNLTWQHPNDTKESLGITTNNWHEECDRLSEEVSKLDFDIAFLSCGSYAMYLGYFIKNSLHKKSIYIGGSLNLFFSIYGERWKLYFSSPTWCNLEYVLDAFENETAKKITAGRDWQSESVNAYFGYRKK